MDPTASARYRRERHEAFLHANAGLTLRDATLTYNRMRASRDQGAGTSGDDLSSGVTSATSQPPATYGYLGELVDKPFSVMTAAELEVAVQAMSARTSVHPPPANLIDLSIPAGIPASEQLLIRLFQSCETKAFAQNFLSTSTDGITGLPTAGFDHICMRLLANKSEVQRRRAIVSVAYIRAREILGYRVVWPESSVVLWRVLVGVYGEMIGGWHLVDEASSVLAELADSGVVSLETVMSALAELEQYQSRAGEDVQGEMEGMELQGLDK